MFCPLVQFDLNRGDRYNSSSFWPIRPKSSAQKSRANPASKLLQFVRFRSAFVHDIIGLFLAFSFRFVQLNVGFFF